MFGYDTGIVAGAQLYLDDTWPDITTEQVELVVSLATLGAFVGAIVAGPMSDKIGRKPVIILADILFTAGSVMMYFAPTIPILMGARIIVGLGIGLASQIVPIYLSEVCPAEVRGAVVAVDILFITGGQFISSIISLALGSNWRLMLGLAAVPSAL